MATIPPVYRQFITVICCNLLAFSLSLSDGWITINYVDLQSENTTFPAGPVSSDQMPLLVSISNIGAILGNFAVVPIGRAIGIKSTIHFMGVPVLLSIALIVWSKNVYYLLVSRFLCGLLSGVTYVAIPTFTNAIAFDNIRGALNSMIDPSYSLGTILSFYLGSCLSLVDQAKVQLVIPTIFLTILFFFPETPQFWTNRNNQQKAAKARQFYRGKEKNEPEKTEFLPEAPKDPSSEDKSNAINDKSHDNEPISSRIASTWKQFQSRHARRAFFITFTSLFTGFFCGVMFMFSYMTDIFDKTGSSFTPKNSSLMFSIVTFCTNLVYANIVERFNRKTLYISSAILTATSYFLFAIYCTLWLKQPGYEWMPTVCFTGVIVFCALGLMPVPFTLMYEIFPDEIRDISLAISVTVAWIASFILGNVFPAVLPIFGYPVLFTFFGAVCTFNAIFGLIFFPETRRKSYEEIKKLMTK